MKRAIRIRVLQRRLPRQCVPGQARPGPAVVLRPEEELRANRQGTRLQGCDSQAVDHRTVGKGQQQPDVRHGADLFRRDTHEQHAHGQASRREIAGIGGHNLLHVCPGEAAERSHRGGPGDYSDPRSRFDGLSRNGDGSAGDEGRTVSANRSHAWRPERVHSAEPGAFARSMAAARCSR